MLLPATVADSFTDMLLIRLKLRVIFRIGNVIPTLVS
jgi:hypothetical protein